MTSPLVHIDGISKRFGDAIALEQLSLEYCRRRIRDVLRSFRLRKIYNLANTWRF